MLRLFVMLFCAAAVLGCEPVRKRCSNVRCDSNQVCDEATGLCVKGDGGTVTPVVDAGTKDAGVVDAGPVDAGKPCVGGCDGGVCDPGTGTCVGCLSSAQCACPSPVCDLARNACVDALADAGPLLQPVGESCADAQAIVFPQCSPKATAFTVDLGPRTDDLQGSCSADAGLGRDAVFLLNVPEVSDVRVSTRKPAGSVGEAVTYLRMTPCATAAELVCKDSFGAPSSMRAKAVPPGVYTVVVDAYDQMRSGPIDVTVELLPAITNETCATPLPMPVDGGSVSVDLSGAGDDLAASCNTAANSRDVVYQFTLTAPSDVTAIVSAGDGGADPVVSVRGSPCSAGADAGNELACVDTLKPSERVSLRGLGAGTYYLVVEGYGEQGSGPVTVTGTVTPPVPYPPNDLCAAARVIDFSAAASSTFTVDTSDGRSDYEGTCAPNGTGGRDVVYTFTLTAPKFLTVTTETAAGDEVDPVVYLRSGSCETGPQLDCQDDFLAPELIQRSLPAGTYFLFIDGYGPSGSGPTRVTVSVQ